MTTHTITQTVGKAAGKTALQAFIAVLALDLLPVLFDIQSNLTDGTFVASDLNIIPSILVAGIVAAIAALISAAWNWSKADTDA